MPKHPEPHIRHAVRVLAAVRELHKRGYQRLRVMPFMSPSGAAWRCWIAPVQFFYRNHGAILLQTAMSPDDEPQERAIIAQYTTGQDPYFGWKDAEKDNARSLADKFLKRFCAVAESGRGWDYPYGGWYQRLLWHTEAGWLPVVIQDCSEVAYDHIPLEDFRPSKRRVDQEKKTILPLPPPGELQQDYGGRRSCSSRPAYRPAGKAEDLLGDYARDWVVNSEWERTTVLLFTLFAETEQARLLNDTFVNQA
jgi:hypothetical protein